VPFLISELVFALVNSVFFDFAEKRKMDKSFESNPDSAGNASDITNIKRQFQEYRERAVAELTRTRKELAKLTEEVRWQQSDSLDQFREIRNERDKSAEIASLRQAEIALLGRKLEVLQEEAQNKQAEFEAYQHELMNSAKSIANEKAEALDKVNEISAAKDEADRQAKASYDELLAATVKKDADIETLQEESQNKQAEFERLSHELIESAKSFANEKAVTLDKINEIAIAKDEADRQAKVRSDELLAVVTDKDADIDRMGSEFEDMRTKLDEVHERLLRAENINADAEKKAGN
jgi:chromosome segregation ATPase